MTLDLAAKVLNAIHYDFRSNWYAWPSSNELCSDYPTPITLHGGGAIRIAEKHYSSVRRKIERDQIKGKTRAVINKFIGTLDRFLPPASVLLAIAVLMLSVENRTLKRRLEVIEREVTRDVGFLKASEVYQREQTRMLGRKVEWLLRIPEKPSA